VKRFLTAVIVVMFFSIPSYGMALKGYFVDYKGNTQVVGEFLSFVEEFGCTFENNKVKIPIADLKEILKLDDTGKILLIKRNGKKFEVQGTFCHLFRQKKCKYSSVNYTFYDKINEKYSEGTLHHSRVKRIVFDDDFGELRKCPKCNKTFPPDHLFCPYDKTDLKLVKIAP
jgi:hypothetical protein